VVAAANDDYIYLSNDYGATFAELTNGGLRKWRQVRCSNDCSTIVGITSTQDPIFISYDYGVNWTAITDLGIKKWFNVTMDGDASRLLLIEDVSFGSNVITAYHINSSSISGEKGSSIDLVYQGDNKFVAVASSGPNRLN
jgi:hypothetical protein